jgi:VWFA-related protein
MPVFVRNFLSRCLCLLIACASTLAGRAQTAQAPVVTSQPGGGTSPNSPQYTMSTRVPITILDIVVTNAKGQPVHGLKQSDFTILEDKQPMLPNSFEEHRSDVRQPLAPAPKQPLPPNTFTNDTLAPANPAPLVILLLDPLNIQIGEQTIVRKRVLDFIDKLPAGTRMAVLNLYSHLSIVQGFTTDRELLMAALSPRKTPLTVSPIEDPFNDATNLIPLDVQSMPPGLIVDRQGEASAFRGQYELSGLNQIARYLSGIPGRKNIIWFSGSFPLRFPPWQDGTAFPPLGRLETYDFEPQMHAVLDLLARAHVTVYPVDARGLRVPPYPGPGNANFQIENSKETLLSEHFTMETIAEQTGGKAFYNTNDLAAAAEQALQLGSDFYTVTYTPTNQKLDTRFRTISVKVDQPNLHLSYRNGYYALDPGISLSGVKVPHPTAAQFAMLHGAPDMTEILFKVAAVRAPTTEDILPADSQRSSPEMKPPYRRYSLTYTADIHNIAFTQGPDGNYTADFEFQATVFSAATGAAINTTNREVRPVEPASNYQSMLKDGAISTQQIDVPAKGEFFLRIGVHDLNSDRVGAVEIPVSAIRP